MIEFIAGLAPEGETALVVRQKVARGKHKDETQKYTWPAFLPADAPSEGSLYANTASFILDRFDGKPSASQDNCEHVLVMMLDDIGIKSKEPPLPPTWVMETSKGSFQWGYAFSEQPTKGAFTAAIRAIAVAGYTDPGAVNAVRNFRLPGSINLKPGRDSFASRLVAFHPDRKFTLEQICAALDVVPGEDDTAHVSLRLEDTGSDTVLAWLNDASLVLSRTNGKGWLSVVCPNNAAHSDGSVGARYRPVDRSFCCHHGHCADMTSSVFLEWVGKQGGPVTQHGVRPDLVADVLGSALGKLSPPEDATMSAEAMITLANARERGRIEKAEWYNRYAYVQSDDSYFDQLERVEVTRQVFNALYRHVQCRSIHNGRKVEASFCFDENRVAFGARSLAGMTYAAGDAAVVMRMGALYANLWLDARPASVPGDVTPWLDHCARMLPDADELNHVFDVMAFKIQHPKVKINHAVLHGGDEGCGKDTMWAPFLHAVCGPDMRNRALVSNEMLSANFTYWLQAEIILINELKEGGGGERRALANKLKPVIAAPPETLTVNRKHAHPFDLANRAFVMAFSNDPVPISLSSQDRRWFCVWSRAPRMATADATRMWTWYKSGGFEAVSAWLGERDVRAFGPQATPPMTEYKTTLTENGMAMAESALVSAIRERQWPFQKGVVAGPFQGLCNQLTDMLKVNIPAIAILHALKEGGWEDMGRLASREYPTKRHIFCSPEVARVSSKTDLRRMAEGDQKLLREVTALP